MWSTCALSICTSLNTSRRAWRGGTAASRAVPEPRASPDRELLLPGWPFGHEGLPQAGVDLALGSTDEPFALVEEGPQPRAAPWPSGRRSRQSYGPASRKGRFASRGIAVGRVTPVPLRLERVENALRALHSYDEFDIAIKGLKQP
jgi:hypothetical protein